MEMSRVIFFTTDVMRLVEFYRGHFQLDVVGEPNEHWTELNAGGCNIAFHKTSISRNGEDNGVKVVFGSDDVAGEKKRLEEMGVTMTKISSYETIEMCDGIDPDGNRFQISSRGL